MRTDGKQKAEIEKGKRKLHNQLALHPDWIREIVSDIPMSAKAGDRLVFAFPLNGSQTDQDETHCLEYGRIYTAEKVIESPEYNAVYLVEIKFQPFNLQHFAQSSR